MNGRLLRNADTEFGVFGYLDVFGTAGLATRICTLEDDWRDNQPRVSSIPAGLYVCRRTLYHRGGYETFEITGVPNRSRILIHAGNTEEDIEGCVLVGKDFGALVVGDEDAPGRPRRAKWSVTESRSAHALLMGVLMGVDSFPLEVAWATPGQWRLA